ncbi:MAG: 16S rRNA (uracil(1498)-N(3))-methyltransferase [Verrucomicrobiota bacterium]
MPRFFVDPAKWDAEPCLEGDEARHCSRVLRARPGDSVGVFDGAGRHAEATVLDIGRDHVTLKLGETLHEPVPKLEVVLAQAVIKGKAMDWLLQKAVELGVTSIQPLTTEHAVAQPGEGKEEKWQRLVLEACKQCGRSRMPEVRPMLALDAFLDLDQSGAVIVASLKDGEPLRDRIASLQSPTSITFLIGPEGDFSELEYQKIQEAGAVSASLGSAVLRSETAAIHCISSVSYAFS